MKIKTFYRSALAKSSNNLYLLALFPHGGFIVPRLTLTTRTHALAHTSSPAQGSWRNKSNVMNTTRDITRQILGESRAETFLRVLRNLFLFTRRATLQGGRAYPPSPPSGFYFEPCSSRGLLIERIGCLFSSAYCTYRAQLPYRALPPDYVSGAIPPRSPGGGVPASGSSNPPRSVGGHDSHVPPSQSTETVRAPRLAILIPVTPHGP